jgi:suppressor of ftsI
LVSQLEAVSELGNCLKALAGELHIHQVHFLVYERAGVPVRRPEWMDTVNLAPNESLNLVMDFTDPIIRGVSVFHCHLLKHEDKGMMAL